MLEPGRYNYSLSKYRYGFNGKEKDNDIEGDGNIYDYGFRIYDPRLGRFKSVDPLTYSYPYYTPYQFAGNMPIAAIDLDGLEQYVVTYHKDQNNTTTKIEIRAIFKNGAKFPENQRVHKIGSTEDIAKGNVMVFEIKKDKNKNESMKIIERRDNNNLTKEEAKGFKKTKENLEKESNERQSLVYGTNKPKQDLYESVEFENKKTQTYTSDLGIVPSSSSPTSVPPTQTPSNVKTVVEVEIFVTGSKGDPGVEFEANVMLPDNFKKAGSEQRKIFKADIVILKHVVHYNTDPKTMGKSGIGQTPTKNSGELREIKRYTIP